MLEYARAVIEPLLDRIPEADWRDAEQRVLERAKDVASVQGGLFRERDVFQRLKGRTGMPGAVFKRVFRTHVETGEFVPVQAPAGWFMIANDFPCAPSSSSGAVYSQAQPINGSAVGSVGPVQSCAVKSAGSFLEVRELGDSEFNVEASWKMGPRSSSGPPSA